MLMASAVCYFMLCNTCTTLVSCVFFAWICEDSKCCSNYMESQDKKYVSLKKPWSILLVVSFIWGIEYQDLTSRLAQNTWRMEIDFLPSISSQRLRDLQNF